MRFAISQADYNKINALCYPATCDEGRVLTRWPVDCRKCAAALRALCCFDNTRGGVRIKTLPVGSWLATWLYFALNGKRLAGMMVAFARATRMRIIRLILRLG